MEIPLDQLEIYAFCDPASGKQVIRRVRARSAIVVVGADQLNRVFTLLAWAGRPTTPTLVRKIIEVGDRYQGRLRRFGIEANAMQSLFAELVAHQAKELKKKIPFVPIDQPSKIDKDWRIRTTLQPLMSVDAGRLFVHESQHELKAELLSFPVGATKDLVDALASAVRLVPRRVPQQKKSEEIEALASYLRASGCPPDYISRRIAEVEAERENGLLDFSLDKIPSSSL